MTDFISESDGFFAGVKNNHCAISKRYKNACSIRTGCTPLGEINAVGSKLLQFALNESFFPHIHMVNE